MSSAETRLDGTTLGVRIPMRFQRRGGRKRIVAPDGSELAPSAKPQPDGTLLKALARAWRWQRMPIGGEGSSVGFLPPISHQSARGIRLITPTYPSSPKTRIGWCDHCRTTHPS
jgi:hypothetical protein